MNVKFDYKVLAFRVFTLVYTAFLVAFCKSYAVNPDLNKAALEGMTTVLPALFAAFGLDKTVYHYVKNTQSS